MKKAIMTRAMAAAVAAAMTAASAPIQTFAVTGDETAADGIYTASTTVTDIDEEGWFQGEYTINVSVTVVDGIITNVEVSSADADTLNSSYMNWGSTSAQKAFIGQPATENTVESWDAVSSATYTARGIKTAALSAIQQAGAAVTAPQVDTTALSDAINAAEAANYAEKIIHRGAGLISRTP